MKSGCINKWKEIRFIHIYMRLLISKSKLFIEPLRIKCEYIWHLCRWLHPRDRLFLSLGKVLEPAGLTGYSCQKSNKAWRCGGWGSLVVGREELISPSAGQKHPTVLEQGAPCQPLERRGRIIEQEK